MMKKIAIDVDEVLTPFLPGMMKWKRPRALPKKFTYLYRDIYKISEQESQKMVHQFYESPEFMKLEPIKDSQKVLKLLKQSNKLYVVTGRQNSVRTKTEDWIEKWYPGIFEDVILTNSYTPQEVLKSDVCRNLNIGLLIDDNFATCTECMSLGVNAVNFIGDPTYPWCFESDISKKSWEDVWMSLKH
jgi:5'(3')-deoxyribonucleotidase